MLGRKNRLKSHILTSLLALLFVACNRERGPSISGDPTRGKEAIQRYGCNSCHNIPGVPGPKGIVGPPLDRMATRGFIAGKLPNNPQTMIQWLQNPPAFDAQSAM